MQRGGARDLLLDRQRGETGRVGVQPFRGRDPAGLDGVGVLSMQGHEAIVGLDIGKLERRHPLGRRQGCVPGPPQGLGQGEHGRPVGSTVEAAHPNVDWVDRAPSDGLHEQVADALELQAPFHRRPVERGELHGVLATEEVRCMEQVDVQGMALDPLAAVQQPAQGHDGRVDGHAASVLDRRAGAHLVSDRADAADARGDLRRLAVASPPSSASKNLGGSKMLSATSPTSPSRTSTCNVAFPFDARQAIDVETSPGRVMGHGRGSLP